MAEEYREHFGEHAYDEQGNYIGTFEPETESQAAWADLAAEYGVEVAEPHAAEDGAESAPPEADAASDEE